MQYRKLGSSDVQVSAITFGAWAIGGFMWGGADQADAIDAINASIDLGVTSIDTAPMYGMGFSEQLVGKAVAPKRDKVQILTKFGLSWEGSEGAFHFEMPDPAGRMVRVYRNARPKAVTAECERSLKLLGTDRIDLYQQHWPDPTTPIVETMTAVARLVKAGKVRAVGVSNFSPEQIDEARTVLPVAAVQPPYSMVNRGIEKTLLPYCRRNNIGVVVYSPLQRGLLTGKIDQNTQFKPGDHRAVNPFFTPDMRRKASELLREIKPIAEEHRVTLAQVVVNWTAHREGISAALVGARDARQASENARSLDFALRPEQMARIDALVADMFPL
jgi:aryl-alcohol dehydrogenase-like predicted oxidoreductase